MLLNGNLIYNENINLDSGLYFGRGLFETMLVTSEPKFLDYHLARINKGLPLIGIDKLISKAEVLSAVKKLNCHDCVLKLTVTEKNTIFTTRKNNYTEKHYAEGFKLKISSNIRNEFSTLTYVKSLNYLDNILEHEKALLEGFNEVIFFNTAGYLSEGSLSNIFFIKDNKLFTPAVNCGLLEGTIRNFVINNFSTKLGSFTKEELLTSDAIFLTNSLMGIMPVSSLKGKCFNIKHPLIEELHTSLK